MRPNMKEVYAVPHQASLRMSPSNTKILADQLIRHTTIKNINQVVVYLDRLKDVDIDAAWKIIYGILDKSGGFTSPLVRANNSNVKVLLISLADMLVDALEELDEQN